MLKRKYKFLVLNGFRKKNKIDKEEKMNNDTYMTSMLLVYVSIHFTYL